jgi:hypothetical protein
MPGWLCGLDVKRAKVFFDLLEYIAFRLLTFLLTVLGAMAVIRREW